MANEEVDDILKSKLKKVSVRQLEDAIAKAITDLVGAQHTCAIKDMNFGAYLDVTLTLTLSQPLKTL